MVRVVVPLKYLAKSGLESLPTTRLAESGLCLCLYIHPYCIVTLVATVNLPGLQEVPELIQRVQSHQVQLSIICCWERTSAQILIKCGERYDVGDKQRSTTFEGLESTGAKVKKIHSQLFETQMEEKSAQDLG